MKSVDRLRSSSLPVPTEQADALIARYGRQLTPTAPASDPFFTSIDCSADGKTIIGVGNEFLLVWDAESSEPCERVQISGGITCAAINSTGSAAIVGTATGDVLILKISGLDVVARRKAGRAIHAVDIANTYIGVYCDVAGGVTAFDYARHEDLPPIAYRGSAGRVWLTHEAELLVVDDEQTVYLFHPKQGWLESTYYYSYRDEEDHALSASGWLVAKRDNQVHIWNRSTASRAAVLDHETRVCAFDMDGSMSMIATLTADQKLHLHTPRDLSARRPIHAAQTYVKDPHSVKLRGQSIFLGGCEPAALQVTRQNRPVRTYYDRLIPIVSAMVSPDERWITVGDQAGGVTVYDTKEGCRAQERIEMSELGAVSVVDADGNTVIAGGHDGALRVIHLDRAAEVRRLDCGGDAVQAACLANGHAYVGSSDGFLAALDLDTGKPIQRFQGHSARIRSTLVYDGRLITTDQLGGLCIFDISSSTLLHRLQLSGIAYRACLDKARGRIYSGGSGGRIVGWDLDTGALVDEILINRSEPRYLQIRGDTLVSLGLDGDLRVFDMAERRSTLTIDIPGPGWQRFAYLNKGRTRLMTAGADGVMRFYCARSGALRAQGLHLARGHCWFGHESDGARADWLWTDQEQSLDIVASCGEDVEVLAPESDERKAFLLERNSKRTMSFVGMAGQDEPQTSGSTAAIASVPRRLTGPEV